MIVSILITFLYVVVCVFLILVVLLQAGKRADLAGAFGGGGSQTAFGARGGATFLSRATTVFAILFMVLALTLSIMRSGRTGEGSVLEEHEPSTTSAPAVPPPASELPVAPSPAPGELPVDPAPLDPVPPAGETGETPPPPQQP